MSRYISTGRDRWTAQFAPSRQDPRIRIQPMDPIKRGLGWFPMAVLIGVALIFVGQCIRWAL